MKTLLILAALILGPAIARAMIYLDYRVVSQEELAKMGVEIEAFSIPPSRISIKVTVKPTSNKSVCESISFTVLDTAPDQTISSASPRPGELADPSKWGQTVRGENSRTGTLKFSVSESEMPRSFIAALFTLPPKDGVQSEGAYFFLLRELPKG